MSAFATCAFSRPQYSALITNNECSKSIAGGSSSFARSHHRFRLVRVADSRPALPVHGPTLAAQRRGLRSAASVSSDFPWQLRLAFKCAYALVTNPPATTATDTAATCGNPSALRRTIHDRTRSRCFRCLSTGLCLWLMLTGNHALALWRAQRALLRRVAGPPSPANLPGRRHRRDRPQCRPKR